MNGFENLYCMEVEPTVDMDELAMTDGMNQDAADGIKRCVRIGRETHYSCLYRRQKVAGFWSVYVMLVVVPCGFSVVELRWDICLMMKACVHSISGW